MLQLSDFQKKVFDDRYALKDENGKQIEFTPEEMWRRVANCIAKTEDTEEKRSFWEESFYDALKDFQFVPGGRILSGAGNSGKVTFYNCFVIPSPEDSRAGILDNVKLMVEIMSRSGGVGVNISSLRPRGAYVRGVHGTASGAVSFGGLYSYATGLITQGGSRRGALMLMLNDDHPDIEEFITVKRTMGLVTNANLSVCVSDKFMDAVKNDSDWDLKWGGKVYKTIKAKYLWNLVCESAHASGEPGLFFIERANKQSNTWYFEELISTNPCVTGDTMVSTGEGLVRMKEVVESHFEGGKRFGGNMSLMLDQRVFDIKAMGTKLGRATKFFNNGVQDIFKLITKSGFELKGTADHKVLTVNGWVEFKNLKKGDKVFIQSGKGQFGKSENLAFTTDDPLLPKTWSKELGQVMGWLIGDGWVRTGDENCRVGFTFGKDDKNNLDYIKEVVNKWYGKDIKQVRRERNVYHLSYHGKRLVDFFLNLGAKPVMSNEKEVPESIYTAPEDAVIGFLQGLFTSDGTVNFRLGYSSYVRLTSKSKELLKGVQLLLLNLGIFSRIMDRSRAPRVGLFKYIDKNGQARSYASDGILYELKISRESVMRFFDIVGFLNSRHEKKIEKFHTKGYYPNKFDDEVVNVEFVGKDTVYDLTEENSYTFITNGVVSYDCGEQPLGAWSVCNLGAMNLSSFVTEEGVFDMERLRRMVRIAMRFLDNVIEATYYPYPENERAQKNIRRTGLGTMGLADALIKLKIRYGSEEAKRWCEEVYGTIRDEAYRASVEIAAEKGPFLKYDKDKYMQGHFIGRLPRDIQEGIMRFGIRNAVVLTQAPTGTTSAIAGVSSGIEPVYDFVTIRRDRLGEHELLHPLYQKYVDENGRDAMLPAWFANSKDLTPEEHVEMQAVIQQYTDSSISKTVNAPESHTVEAVQTLYMKAYELGCKGVTYFRENSRDVAVLYSKKDLQKKEQEKLKSEKVDVAEKINTASTMSSDESMVNSQGSNVTMGTPRPRPEVTHGSTYKVKTGYGTLFVTINNDDEGKPFEVFATIGKTGGFFAAKSEAICRLTSLALRSGIEPETVVDQLRGIRGPMPSWGKYGQVLSIPDAVAHVMLEHLGRRQQKLSLFKEESPESLQVGSKELAPGETFDLGLEKNPAVSVSVADRGFAPECPDCGTMLHMSEGCMSCSGCGYSKCG